MDAINYNACSPQRLSELDKQDNAHVICIPVKAYMHYTLRKGNDY